MGAAQASDTVFSILARAKERGDKKAAPEELEELARQSERQSYEEQTDIRYGAPRVAGSMPSSNLMRRATSLWAFFGMSADRPRKGASTPA